MPTHIPTPKLRREDLVGKIAPVAKDRRQRPRGALSYHRWIPPVAATMLKRSASLVMTDNTNDPLIRRGLAGKGRTAQAECRDTTAINDP